MLEGVDGVPVKGVGWAELFMAFVIPKWGATRPSAKQDVDCWGWKVRVEVLELLKGCLLLGGDSSDPGLRRRVERPV